MLNGIVEFLGWFGAVTVLAGYILFSTGKLPNGPVYQLLNLVGGLAIAVNVGAHHAIPSLIVNGIWAIVAVVVLTKMLRVRRASQRGEPVDVTVPHVLVEPPTTTAVLPVVGPALRDHDTAPEGVDAEDAGSAPVAPALESAPAPATAPAIEAAPAPAALATENAPAAAAPMTETVPVITATIALALVAAAHREHAQRDDPQHALGQGHHDLQHEFEQDAHAPRDHPQHALAQRDGAQRDDARPDHALQEADRERA